MPKFEVTYNGGMVVSVNAATEEGARRHIREIEAEVARKIGREPHVNISGVKKVKD